MYPISSMRRYEPQVLVWCSVSLVIGPCREVGLLWLVYARPIQRDMDAGLFLMYRKTMSCKSMHGKSMPEKPDIDSHHIGRHACGMQRIEMHKVVSEEMYCDDMQMYVSYHAARH